MGIDGPQPRSVARSTVFRGGPVLTMTSRGTVESLVVRDGRVVAVGDRALGDAEVASGADVVELGGATLAPGFIDAHCHLSIAALEPDWVDCSAIADDAALAEALRALRLARPEGTWVRAARWDENATGLRPTRAALDEAVGDAPAIVVHHTFHQAMVNSAALDVLGIGRRTGGSELDGVDRDPSGAPTGLLVERAFGRAHSVSVRDYTEPRRWAELVAARARRLHRHGITAVHDAAVDPDAEAMYRSLAARGELPVGVLAMPHATPFLSNDPGDRLEGPVTGEGDEWLRVGPVKFFADGGVAPAIDVHVGGHHVAIGQRFDDLADAVVRATSRGFRVAVHAMGNAGITAALDAFAEADRSAPHGDHRPRLEHAGLASPMLARRAAGLGAVGVVQPGFVESVGRSTAGFEPDDATWLPFATLAEAGVPIAGSSDDPCGPIDPLHCAVLGSTRRTSNGLSIAPGESIPVSDWLHAYTAGAAFAGGQEHERGSLQPGLRADLVVLAPTDSATEPYRVDSTWIDGACVWNSDGTEPV